MKLNQFQRNITRGIKIGDRLPKVTVYRKSPANSLIFSDYIGLRKVVVIGVPGAFTPGCSASHVPSYIKQHENLTRKGIDEVVVVSVNDPYVMDKWHSSFANNELSFMSDPKAQLANALDLSVSLDALGGDRFKRFAMLMQDGVVKALEVEPDNTGISITLADSFINKI